MKNPEDLGFTIKIISPNININRYFQNENPKKFISELIAETAVIVDILKFSIFYFIKIKKSLS